MGQISVEQSDLNGSYQPARRLTLLGFPLLRSSDSIQEIDSGVSDGSGVEDHADGSHGGGASCGGG